MKRVVTVIVVLTITVAGNGAAQARVAVPIVNPGFEANFAADGTLPVMVPQGRELVDLLGVINPMDTTFFARGVPEGRNAALIFLADPASTPVGLRQVLTTSLQARRCRRLMSSDSSISTVFPATPCNCGPAFNRWPRTMTRWQSREARLRRRQFDSPPERCLINPSSRRRSASSIPTAQDTFDFLAACFGGCG